MTTTNGTIVGTMTIHEAASHWSDPRCEQLKRWAEAFGVRLQDLHPGHVRTYQQDRSKEASASQVDSEIDALLALLEQIGLGDEIKRYYHPFSETGELTEAEINTLSEPARKYIDKLLKDISDLKADNERMKNRIRRANWGRSR
jgi:hypothetical protein